LEGETPFWIEGVCTKKKGLDTGTANRRGGKRKEGGVRWL